MKKLKLTRGEERFALVTCSMSIIGCTLMILAFALGWMHIISNSYACGYFATGAIFSLVGLFFSQLIIGGAQNNY